MQRPPPAVPAVALALGFAFHVAVPVLGKVAPDLNFIFVVTYLFFAFRPAERRPVVRLADGSPFRLWGPRLDLLGRIDWRAGAGEASRIEVDGVETALSSRRGVATLAFQVVGMNPFFLVYVPFWIDFLLPVVKDELNGYWADYRAGRLRKFGRAASPA